MKLHCFGHSGHSYKIASYLNLAGIDWEPIYIDFFNGATRSDEYRKLNEMGEAPVLVDGQTILSQSGVILDYLVEKTGHFAPENARENLRWILWDNHKGSSQIGITRFLNNVLPEDKRPNEVIEFSKGRVQAALSTLNTYLETHDFLSGEKLSTSDLSCSSYLFYPEDFGWSRNDTPAIDAWLSRIENMPNWKHPYDLMPTDQSVLNATPSASAWHKEA